MQRLRRRCSTDLTRLSPSSQPSVSVDPTAQQTAASKLSIEETPTAGDKIRRLINEHPVVIFSRSSCCMCHVMKRLLSAVGVHPTVIELDDEEVAELRSFLSGGVAAAPAVFIGGACVGGLESLVALHLGGRLVPRLVEVGALYIEPLATGQVR